MKGSTCYVGTFHLRIQPPPRKLFKLITILCFGLSLSVAATAHAATYYVATTGNDSNAGTEAAPFKTIARGSQAIAAGDTMLIRGGTYNETMLHSQNGFKFTNGISVSARTRYSAYPGEKVIISPATKVPMLLYFDTDSSYIEVNGITFNGTNTTSVGVIGLGYADDDSLLSTHHLRFSNNEVFGGGFVAIRGVNNELIGNHIHHSKIYGIYAAGNGMLIEGNVIHDIGGHGLHLYKYGVGDLAPNNNIVRNNVFYNTGYEFYHSTDPNTKRQVDAVLIRGINNQFYNNIIYKSYGGVIVGYGTTGTLVANNTIYGNDTIGINISSKFAGGKNARIINNIVYGNGGSQQIEDTATGTTLQNNLTTDPKFVNPAAGDFGLQAGSPAIDKGMTLAEVKTDFTGKARPEGAAYDIGAFEGAGSKANVLPGMAGGLPAGVGSGSGGGGLGTCYK